MSVNISELIFFSFLIFVAALTFFALFVVNKSDKELNRILESLGYVPNKKQHDDDID